jgi:hypothetical protein
MNVSHHNTPEHAVRRMNVSHHNTPEHAVRRMNVTTTHPNMRCAA